MMFPIMHQSEKAPEPEYPAEAPSLLTRRMEEFFHERRQIILWGPVEEASARMIVERLFYLNGRDEEKPITLMINSPGGSTSAGLAIVDAMELVRAPIHTTCLGIALSFGAVLLACGSAGGRRAAPRARIMIHQPWVNGRIEGRPVEVIRHAREIQNTRIQLNQVLAQRTGQPIERIEEDTDRDFWMSADEARTYGLIDEILLPEDISNSARLPDEPVPK